MRFVLVQLSCWNHFDFFQAICTYTKCMHILGIFIAFIFLRAFFFYFRIYSYALSNLFLLQFGSYNLFILPDICTFKKVGHIIIYERWIYYQDFYFKFSQNTADMFKYNDIIHLCHEYQFDDKICSLQKQLQILHIFGEGLIFLIS